MSRTIWRPLSIVALMIAPVRAHATTVTVPDDFSTIQLALYSEADTVRIRAGHYAERPYVSSDNGSRVIEGLPSNGVRPSIEGLTLGLYQPVTVYACTFTRPVDLGAGAGLVRLTFDSCDLDSGLVHHIADTNDYEYVALLRSRIRVGVTLPAYTSICEADTFEACGVVFDNESSAEVTNCWFKGPAPTAIAIRYDGFGGSGGHFRENTIDGYRRGIEGGGPDASITVEGNRIERCTEGIRVQNENSDHIRNNLVRDCETGIAADSYGSLEVSGNVVLGSTQAGIDVHCDNSTHPVITGNVVGRSGSDGIRLEQLAAGVTLVNNTSYRNAGAGFKIQFNDTYDLRLENNIGFENGTYGVDADTSATPDSCNNWYGNHSGATRGVTSSGTNFAIDPLFCNVHIDSVALSAKSPLVDPAGCGLIGARGVGCATTPTLVTLFTVQRDAEGVRVRWHLADPAHFGDVWVERADGVAGPWARVATEQITTGDVSVALDRGALAERDYWYRLVAREGNEAVVISESVTVPGSVPHRFELVRVKPNPGFGPMRISFTLPREAVIAVNVIDLQGRYVASLVNGALTAGTHTVEWSGQSAAPGTYFIGYRYPGGHQVERVVRLR